MTVVQYYKYPRTLHWRHELLRLGEDEHGVWLGGPTGTRVQKGEEEPINYPRAFVQLVTPRAWWTALFNQGHRIDVYVDITTAANWPLPDRVEMIDLDLDVIRLRDGTVYVDDEDEFEDHRVRLAYPPRMADSARATAAEVTLALEKWAPPFDGSASRWLEMVS